VEIIREGKNITQVQARAVQNQKICVVSQICFGQNRPSKITVNPKPSHAMQMPEKPNYIPQIPKI